MKKLMFEDLKVGMVVLIVYQDEDNWWMSDPRRWEVLTAGVMEIKQEDGGLFVRVDRFDNGEPTYFISSTYDYENLPYYDNVYLMEDAEVFLLQEGCPAYLPPVYDQAEWGKKESREPDPNIFYSMLHPPLEKLNKSESWYDIHGLMWEAIFSSITRKKRWISEVELAERLRKYPLDLRFKMKDPWVTFLQLKPQLMEFGGLIERFELK